MFFLSYVYRYQLLYVYDSGPDTKGLFYPRALMQLMVGLYIAQICLIGLFALKSGFYPLILMVVFLIFTALVHISLNEALTPLLNNLPRTLALEQDNGPLDDAEERTDTAPEAGLAADYYAMADDDDDDGGSDADAPPAHDLDTDIQLRGIEGSSSLKYTITQWTKSFFKSGLKPAKPDPAPASSGSPFTLVLTQIKNFLTPDPARKPNPLLRFLHPEVYQDFRTLQRTVNPEPGEAALDLPADYARRAYWYVECSGRGQSDPGSRDSDLFLHVWDRM